MKLPPLNAVRAFEAVARHGSFRLAAEELFVTPGAVSQQVRALEDWLGTRLLDRRPSGVVATEAGAQFQAVASRSLRALAQAADRLQPGARVVRVSSLVSIAARWLLPRLESFTRQHPRLQVQIDASNAVADFDRDAVDLAIRHADHAPRGLGSHELVVETLYPVATPAYARKHVRRGRILPSARLLHETGTGSDDYWAMWLARHAVDERLDAAGGLYFSHEMLTLGAARAGQGIALANRFLIAEEVVRRELVVALDAPLATGKRYYVVWPERPLREPVRLFRDWLVDEFARSGVGASAGRTA